MSRSRPIKDKIVYFETCKDALVASPDYAIIASPASEHLDHARPFVEAGVPTLIEKPMAITGDKIDQFLDLIAQPDIRLGYVLRQSHCLKAAKHVIEAGGIGRVQYARIAVGMNLADWRPGTDPSKGVSARLCSGGGALLELSHEIDLARWFLGSCVSLYARSARLGSLTVDAEDFVEIVATFSGGVEVNLHLDMLARPGYREGHIFGACGQIKYQLNAQRARAEIFDGDTWRILAEDTAPLAELFDRQLATFVSTSGRSTLASAEDGRAIAKFIDAARQSAVERRVIETGSSI